MEDRRVSGLNNKLQTLVLVITIVSALFGAAAYISKEVSETVIENVLSEDQVKEIAITATEETIMKFENEQTLDAASAVLQTLVANHINDPNDINEFLANKPAGRTDLLKGVVNEEVYVLLVETYGGLAKNAKIALDH